MSRTSSTNDPNEPNYLCVQPEQQNVSYEGLERANSFNNRINHCSKNSKTVSSNKNGSAIKFFSLRNMIRNEKNDQLTSYDVPSTLMLTSSFSNSMTVSSTTNSFETTSSKSSSKSSFFRTLFNSSSTSSIRSINSTPTNSPISKSNSSQSLISSNGPSTTMNLTSSPTAVMTVTRSVLSSNAPEIPLDHDYVSQTVIGNETNNSRTCSRADQNQKKSMKIRNKKKTVDTLNSLSACFRVRSKSGDLESYGTDLLISEIQMNSTDDINRLVVTEPIQKLKEALSLDQDRLVMSDVVCNDKEQRVDDPKIKDDAKSTSSSLLIEGKTNDELMRISGNSKANQTSVVAYLNHEITTQQRSADLIDYVCHADHCNFDQQSSGDTSGKQKEQQKQRSCSEKVNREINLDKGDRTSTVVQYHLATRSDERKNLKKICEIQYLRNRLQLNKSKSANALDDSNYSRKSKQIRFSSANQLPNYDKSVSNLTEQSTGFLITRQSNRPVEQQCSSNKSSQKSSKFGRLRTLISSTKGLNRTKKEQFRESLNNQSANSIEQLLFHEHCKFHINKSIATTTSFQSTATSLKNEIKMKFRRSDAEYNLTKSMKTVDHKDLTLMQILALKPIRSKLKSHQQEKLTSDSLFYNLGLSNKKSSNQRNSNSKLINNKMVLPELSSSPVCAENVPVQSDCFADSAQMFGTRKSTDNHISFTSSKFMANENSFTCDENISKNEQDIYKQQFNSSDELLLKTNNNKEFHQCDKQTLINDSAVSMTSVIHNSSNCSRQWIQLAGHEQSFFNSSKPGIILKKNELNELTAYKKLNEMNDQIIEFIPKFYSVVKTDDGQFIELQDLLSRFDNKCNIIDLKMGTRTFLESDVTNIRARPDLYEKLIKIDSLAATQDEHRMKAITKLRYMTFRENLSSSSTLGFRIEGFRCKCNGMIKDFKYLRKEDEVKKVLSIFMPMNKELRAQLLRRLKLLKTRFKESDFFRNHEVVGSSLLIIHDDNKIGVWMIDFGRTVKLPDGVKINHENKWTMGNHEDGYLTGLNNLIRILKEIN